MKCHLAQEALPIKKLIFSLGLVFTLSAKGVTFIDHFTSQFAGEVGLISMGLGKDFKKYSVGGMYGVVPTEVSGGPFIETVTLRQTFEFYQWERLAAYFGLNIFHVLGIQYRTEDYGDVPDSYYPIGSIRGLLYLGLSTAFNKIETRSIYIEAGLNDLAIVNYINNSEVVKIGEEVSLAIGFKQKF